MRVTSTSNSMRLLEKLRNPGPALQEIGTLLKKSVQERIKDTKTAPDGKAWAPWAPSTAKARQREGTASTGLLYRTGTLFNSIEMQVNQKSVIVGSNESAPYAQFLQTGTLKMPARPFVGVSQDDELQLRNVLLKFIKSQ